MGYDVHYACIYLREYFSTYGEIEFVDIKRKPNGESKGFGFVRFINKEDEPKVGTVQY